MNFTKIFQIAVFITAGSLGCVDPALAADPLTPVGHWKTIDDATGLPVSIVEVFEQDGKLFARIERKLSTGGETTCTRCTDYRKGQPLLGMVFMRNMTQANDEYIDGDILDPNNGKIYRCKIRLESGGHRLVVRGFLGVALFGRSQIWERT
jgi:uncharacterized protein (DUF2147 family)